VSLGGWMRGTEALATVVMQKYTKDGAELLHQPVLVDYFIRRLENGTKFKNKRVVEKMRGGMKSIHPLLGKEGEAVPEKTVEEIRVICERLNNLIHAKEKQ